MMVLCFILLFCNIWFLASIARKVAKLEASLEAARGEINAQAAALYAARRYSNRLYAMLMHLQRK